MREHREIQAVSSDFRIREWLPEPVNAASGTCLLFGQLALTSGSGSQKREEKMAQKSVIVFLAFLFACCIPHMAKAETVAANQPAEERASFAPLEKIGEWEVQAGASTDFYSAYVWRGQVLVDDPVFQPSAYVGIKNFTASIWGNYSFDDGEWTELDYTLDYTTGLGTLSPKMEKVSVSAGYIYYDFPNLPAGDDSQELYAKAALDAFLSPSLAIYWDFDQGDGTYYEAGLSHSQQFGKMALNLCATVGYNNGQWDFASSFSNALFGASLAIPVGERISIEPGVFYSLALDNQYEDEFYGGVSVSLLIWE